jgi:hypothetical protein
MKTHGLANPKHCVHWCLNKIKAFFISRLALWALWAGMVMRKGEFLVVARTLGDTPLSLHVTYNGGLHASNSVTDSEDNK